MTNLYKSIWLRFLVIFFCFFFISVKSVLAFRFISWGDAQDGGSNFKNTSNQAATLNPAFAIFNGDFESDGFQQTLMNTMVTALNGGSGKNNGMFNKTFLVRGNHDNHYTNPASWQNYLVTANRPAVAGVTNYTGINSSSTYLTYSFDFGNSRFIGVDIPGDVGLITSAQLTFINDRLTNAENKTLNPNLQHVFIYFHGPIYCVSSSHCSCSGKSDSSCTPSSIIDLIKNHPIVSATFHGHEHILGWTHIDSSRLSSLQSRVYEQFMTSPSGAYVSTSNLYSNRVNYAEMTSAQGFAAIDVNGLSFTVNLYRNGSTAPSCKQSINCTKNQTTGNTGCTQSSVCPSTTPPPEITVTPTKPPASCPLKSSGDYNCDGKINESDLNALLGKWMTGEKDITEDGIVNESDLNKLLGNWKTL
ncbi:metallophosphoesterase [Candidatus Microgenomates bacterium]|nr:metallophosphoesterase [Candidatus Microgenomates bacterium]